MYVRTPKRYRGRVRRNIIPFKRILFWFVMLILIGGGVIIYQFADSLQGPVGEAINGVINNMQSGMATMGAPTPTPTQDPTNLIVRADNFWEQGAISQAVQLYIDALPSVPNDVRIYYRVALGKIMLGQEQESLVYADRAITANPYSADAWAIRAWTLTWNNRYGEAMASAIHALELDPDNGDAAAYLAETYYRDGRNERALNAIDRVVDDHPENANAYYIRGIINWAAFYDLDAALEDFQTAYSIAPTMSYIAIDMAALQQSLGNANEAIQTLDDIIEVNPENARALFWLGNLYYANIGDPSQAAAYLSRCVEHNPQSINCYYLLGRSQDRLELYDQAAISFQKAVDLGSTSARHYWWAGNGQLSIGNPAQCLRYLETGYELAQQEGDTQLLQDYESLINNCRGIGGGTFGTPTPLPDPNDTGDSDDT